MRCLWGYVRERVSSMNESIQEKINFVSEKRIDMLKARTKRCVCKYCGSGLRLGQISFNELEDVRIEIFCKNCERIEFGVEPEIYENAKYYVEETGFNYYPDLDETDKTKQMSIAKICEIMTWDNQNLGILTPEGFQIPLNMNRRYVGEMLVLSDDDLQQE